MHLSFLSYIDHYRSSEIIRVSFGADWYRISGSACIQVVHSCFRAVYQFFVQWLTHKQWQEKGIACPLDFGLLIVMLYCVKKIKYGVMTFLIDRQMHKSFFGKSDLFFICMMRPLTFNLQKQDLEIEAAQVFLKIVSRMFTIFSSPI